MLAQPLRVSIQTHCRLIKFELSVIALRTAPPKQPSLKNMISLLAAVAITGSPLPAMQDRQTIMLAAAMIRHQEPVAKGGVRATIAEIYPIAWQTRGTWRDASRD